MTIDFHEAARRIRKIGNWMMLIGASVVGVFLVAVAIDSPSAFMQRKVVSDLWSMMMAILPGIAVRLIAWVVDGFAGPSKSEPAPTNFAQ